MHPSPFRSAPIARHLRARVRLVPSLALLLMVFAAPSPAADDPSPAASQPKAGSKKGVPSWSRPGARKQKAEKPAVEKPSVPVLLKARPWRNAAGEVTEPAELVSVADDAVTLRFAGGEESVVPIDDLFRDDRHLALRERRRVERGRPSDMPDVGATVDGARPDAPPPPLPADFVPASSVVEPPQPLAAGSIDLERTRPGDMLTLMLPGEASGGTVLVEIRDDVASKPSPTRLIWASPAGERRRIVEQQLPAGERLLDYRPGLELLLSVAKTPRGASSFTPDVVTLWDASPRYDSPSPLTRFFVSLHPLDGLPWARIVDDGLVVLLDRDRDVVGWDAFQQRPRFRIRQESRTDTPPVLSPDLRWLALPGSEGATVVDARGGGLLATIPTGRPCAAAAFAEDGHRLALVAGGRILVHDLARRDDEAIVIEAPATDPNGGRIRWIDDDLLAADDLAGAADFTLYQVGYRRPLWEYVADAESTLPPMFVPGGVHYLVPPPVRAKLSSAGTIVAAPLPGSTVARAAARPPAPGAPRIAPGSAVNVYTLCGRDDAAVRAALLEIIERNGWTFDPKSPYTLAGYLFPQKPATIDFRSPRGDWKSGKVTATTAAVRVVTADELLFDKASGEFEARPMLLDEGEAPQQRINLLLPPAAGFFTTASVPDTIGGPGYVGPVGRSTLSPKGPLPVD